MDDVLIIRRLSLPRFLFREAKAALQRPGPYSGGMATSLFQDSVEAFLRILAEHGSVNIGASVPFDKLLDKVGAKFNSVLEHRAVITRLNKVRVNFKHHGQRIVNEEALSFASNVEAFLTEVSSDVLQLDFGSVSLVSAIGHRRTENWLHKAERFAGEGSYRESVMCAAKALAIYSAAMSVGRFRPNNYGMRPRRLDFGNDGRQLRRSLVEFAKWVSDDLKQVHTHIDLIMKGVNIFSYRRFQALTPSVHLSMVNTMWGGWGPGSPAKFSKEDAEFCINFVVDSALQIRDSHIPDHPNFHPEKATHAAAVEHDCDVIVYPNENPQEVIRTAFAGEKLEVISIQSQGETSEYVAVLQDGESAYVRKNCVRVLSTGSK